MQRTRNTAPLICAVRQSQNERKNAMRHLHAIALAALVSVSSVNGAEQGTHLFILSGQSNMRGLNPNKSFTPAVTKEFGEDNVIVVKNAWDGQPILQWYKKWKSAEGKQPEVTGALYDRLMAKVNAAIKGKQIKSVTFIWMQGERDAKGGHSEVYEASLKGLLDQLSTDMERKDIHFVIGRLSDHLMKHPGWVKVRQAQVAVAKADPHGSWVDTDDLNDKKNKKGKQINDLHYSAEGYKILGQRFAEEAIKLINNEPNTH